jgi:hypothetical protein
VPFSMSSLLRNLIEAKANIQIQKTGAETLFIFKSLPASDLERWTKPLRGRFNSQNLLSSVQHQLVYCYYS